MKRIMPAKQNLIWIAPDKLKSNPLNSILYGDNDTNSETLKQSFLTNGFLVNRPILCYRQDKDKSLTIISGHRRRKASVEFGIPEIPVIVVNNVTDKEIERLVIEENLLRPSEGREFSYIERYMLALRLSEKFPEMRGGDRRSEDFRTNYGSRQNNLYKGKDEWLSTVTGICVKYLSELGVIAKCICQDSEKASPELLHGLPIYEQLQIILNKGLCQDLNDLHLGRTSIRKIYNKHKHQKNQSNKANKASPSEKTTTTQTSDIDNSRVSPSLSFPEQAPNPCVTLLQGLKVFLTVHFVGHPNQEKAMLIISAPPPQNPIALLQIMRKATNLLLRNVGDLGTETKKATANQSLPLFEKFENHDNGENNINGGLK